MQRMPEESKHLALRSSALIITISGMKWWILLLNVEMERHQRTSRKDFKDVNYFGTMLTYMGIADGMVSGAIHSTGDTVRPALQIIKTKPGISRTSGAMIMVRGRDQENMSFRIVRST